MHLVFCVRNHEKELSNAYITSAATKKPQRNRKEAAKKTAMRAAMKTDSI